MLIMVMRFDRRRNRWVWNWIPGRTEEQGRKWIEKNRPYEGFLFFNRYGDAEEEMHT